MQYGKFTAPCYGFRVDRYRGIVYLKKKTRNGKWIYTKDVEEAKLFKSSEHLKKKNPEAGYYTDYNGVEIYMTSNYWDVWWEIRNTYDPFGELDAFFTAKPLYQDTGREKRREPAHSITEDDFISFTRVVLTNWEPEINEEWRLTRVMTDFIRVKDGGMLTGDTRTWLSEEDIAYRWELEEEGVI